MSIVYATIPATDATVPVAELAAVIARLERMQSVGASLLSNSSIALRTLRAHLPGDTGDSR